MSVFYAYLSFDDMQKQRWSQQIAINSALAQSFCCLMSSREKMMCSDGFNTVCDHLQNFLSHSESDIFTRYGAVSAPADRIFDHLKHRDSTRLSVQYGCSSSTQCAPPIMVPINDHLPSIFYSSMWTTWCESTGTDHIPATASTQNWIDLGLRARLIEHCSTPANAPCSGPCAISCVHIHNAPPLLVFEIVPGTLPSHIPIKVLNVACSHGVNRYSLRTIVYLGQFHFTTRLLDKQGGIWCYDGQKNGGTASQEGSWSAIDEHLGHINFSPPDII